MPNLRVYVANCLMGGDTVTRTGTSWVRNLVEFSCGGKTIVFTQRDNIAKGSVSGFVGQFCETSEVLVRDVAAAELQKVLTVLDRLCWLLSFAGLSRVMWYGYDYPSDSKLGYRRSVTGMANYFRPVLDVRNGTSVKEFVRQVFAAYAKLEKRRRLNSVIDYLVLAEYPNQPTELKLMLAFVALESLKDTYARGNSIPYLRGAFRKAPKPNSPKYSFEELLHLMLREVKMKKGLRTIVKLRNEIVHSGLSRMAHRRKWAVYEKTHDIIREYMLRLLGYRGNYLTYASGGNAYKTI